MQVPIYARNSDEVGSAAMVTLATGTADADNPVTNVQAMDPAVPFLTSSTGTAVDVVFDHFTAQDVQLFSLHHHNLPAGTEIRIQRNATNAWGAPTIDVPHVIGTYPQPGLPLPIGVDLTAEDGYDAGGFRYSRLHVPSLAQIVGLAAVCWWAAKRTDWDPVLPPGHHGEEQAATTFRTTYGRRRGYRKGIRLRSWPFQMRHEETSWTAFKALFREVSSVLPFLWWPDSTHDSDARLVQFESDAFLEERPAEGVEAGQSVAIHDLAGMLVEMAAGVALPTELVT